MDELIRDHPTKVFTLVALVVAAVLGGLYKVGWINPKKKKDEEWDGTERRSEECPHHKALENKVCGLFKKLDDVESKVEEVDKNVDAVGQRVQYILGMLEARWGRIGMLQDKSNGAGR